MKIRRALIALLTAIAVLTSMLATAPTAQGQDGGSFADTLRVQEVSNVVDAFEAYGRDHDTYVIADAGYLGEGRGWFHKDTGPSYDTSIRSVLAAGGYHPGWTANDAVIGNLAVYPCGDRVGVFSLSDGATPSPRDVTFWETSGCNPYPINGLGLKYFEVSQPLEANPIPTCMGHKATPTTINSAGEIVGTRGDDVIIGTSGDDVIRGLGGNDIICALEGDDWIRGDSGNDIMIPGPGANAVWGGKGDDWAQVTENDAADDDLRGGAGIDYAADEHVPECFPCNVNVRPM